MTGLNLITAARQRQLAPRAADSIRERIANIGADVAGILDDFVGLPVQTTEESSVVDIRAPKIIRLNADGDMLPNTPDADQDHVATLFPQFGLIVDATRPETASNWAEACTKAAAKTICGEKADGLLDANEWALLIDRTRPAPMVNPKALPNARTDYIYWTATPHPSDSDYAFCVSLSYGNVSWGGRSGGGLVVACRRVSPRQ